MQSKEIREFCKLHAAGEELLKMAITKLGLSAPRMIGYSRWVRRIGDMAGCPGIRPEHISEAIQYHSLDRNLMV